MSLNISLNDLMKQAKLAIIQSNNIYDLETIRAKFLGKNGHINQHINALKQISPNIRPKTGLAINKIKKNIQALIVKQQNKLKLNNIQNNLNNNNLDITLPGRFSTLGSLHPITSTIIRMKNFFSNLGFSIVHGSEIENDYFNFSALNIPINHPSRDEHDTFWLNQTHLLRTHISGIQIHIMTTKKPPIYTISFGRVYRKDYDKHHTPMFHQLEGIVIDKNINFSHLKKTLFDFLYFFFEKKIILRFRPSYFPFTEPSAEIDAIIQNESKNWIELLGCGMIHPNILNNAKIDTKKYSGFAFGIGVERLTMLLYHIHDIRIFFKNDLNFLNQFK